MDNLFLAQIQPFYKKVSFKLLFFLVPFFMLASCASSEVSREAASNVDLGMQNAKNLVSGDADVADAYQNSKQMTKGAILGGTAGALTGAVSSGLGVFHGAVIGTILGASFGAYIDSTTTSDDKLENRGVTTVVLGDQVLIVIPSWRLFQPYTSSIKPQAYSTLNLVANYINGYTKMLVKVSGYTSDTGSPSVDISLSQQQAEQVSKFLQASGVDARLLYAIGCGGTHLVQANQTAWGESDNYRIEITLKKLSV